MTQPLTVKAVRGLTSPELVSLFAESVKSDNKRLKRFTADELFARLELQARLLRTLQPFAEAGKEVRSLEGISPEKQWLWKPNQTGRDPAGISAQHVLDAVKVFEELTS